MQNEERIAVLETQSSTQKRILLTLRDIRPEIKKIYWIMLLHIWCQVLGIAFIILLIIFKF